MDEANVIKDLEADTTYKYLGVEEDDNIQHKKMRENVGKEYLRRLKKICRTQLNPKNKISAINQLAIPIMTYSIGIIDWPQRDIDKLDTKTRKILTLHKITYRNQCLDRIYLPRIKGGMGLTELNQVHKSTTISIAHYLYSSTSPSIIMVKDHHNRIPATTSITKLGQRFYRDNIPKNQKPSLPQLQKYPKEQEKCMSTKLKKR